MKKLMEFSVKKLTSRIAYLGKFLYLLEAILGIDLESMKEQTKAHISQI